ncbi:MAG: FAD-dependent oxidoreductase [Aquificaceae bacterium]
MKLLIVGNGPCAVSAIEAFRSIDDQSDILVLTDEEYPAYAPNCMENVIRGDISKEALFFKGGMEFYKKHRVEVLFKSPALSIDATNKSVLLPKGLKESFDKCLLCAGAKAFIPPIPGVNLGGVSTAKNLDDALRIKSWIESGRVKSALIIGAGPIGIEDAQTLSHMGIKVSVVEFFDRVLPRMLDAHMAKHFIQPLIEEGIDFYLNHQVVAIHGEDGWVQWVEIKQNGQNSSKFIQADLVIISTGVRPRVELVQDTDIKLHISETTGKVVGGILVNEYQQTSNPDIYAAGDIASGIDRWGNIRWIALFPSAIQSGAIAGQNIAGKNVKNPGLVDYNAVKTRSVTAASAGTFEDAEESTFFEVSGRLIKLFLKDGALCGYQVVSKPRSYELNRKNPFLRGYKKLDGMGLEESGVLFHHIRERKFTENLIKALKSGNLRAIANPLYEVPLF